MRTMQILVANINVFKPLRPNNDLNDLMWQWFQKLRSQMIPVSGPMMQNKTLTISIRFQSIYRLAAQVYAAI